MQSLLPFLLFAFVATITPGPTNILALGHGARDGAGQPQPAFDHGAAGIGAHPPSVGTPAEQQAEAGDNHGLAGAGLTGDDGESGAQGQGGVGYDAEARDPQLLQHVEPFRSRDGPGRGPGWR